MRILLVATKAPSPITDGGRAVTSATIEMLSDAAGAHVTVVTPRPNDGNDASSERIEAPDAAPHENETIVRSVREHSIYLGWTNSIVRSLGSGRPVTVERHSHAPLAARVAELMREEPPFDVVHVEQLQALAIAEPARRAGVACVLRAQNVESAVWDAAATSAPSWRAAAMRLEARRLRRFEADAIAGVDATIALSADDAAALTALSPASAGRITVVPPPIPSAWLAQNDTDRTQRSVSAEATPGGPTFIWIGSAGWAPNDAAREWLVGDIWPAIEARVPEAHLHLFGAPDAPELRDSADAFMPGGILLIPMRAAAGVRMRVLEAWARGIPVIASPAAVAGLDTEDGRDVLIAAGARAFAEAAARLVTQPSLRTSLVREGRATLARRHDRARLAEATIEVYRRAMTRSRTLSRQS